MKIISTLIATLVATAAVAAIPDYSYWKNFPAPCYPKPCTWALDRTPGPDVSLKKDKKDTTPVASKAESTATK